MMMMRQPLDYPPRTLKTMNVERKGNASINARRNKNKRIYRYQFTFLLKLRFYLNLKHFT